MFSAHLSVKPGDMATDREGCGRDLPSCNVEEIVSRAADLSSQIQEPGNIRTDQEKPGTAPRCLLA